jgi:putative hydrolase of the HAD superfamily
VIRAILFDADGVLQHPSDDLEARLQSALGFVPEPLADFLAEVFEAEGSALAGQVDFVAELDPVLEKWGAQGLGEKLAACWSSIAADEAIFALIARLRRAGYVCALTTNQQRHRAAHMANVLGYGQKFDHSFYSCELGYAKPDASYFRAVMRALPFEPQELLFIDDRRDNVSTAAALGINAVRFVHDKSALAVTALERVLARFGVQVPP